MDKLYYFSGSADKRPGAGSNEHVVNSQDYIQLGQIPNWRKMLSNFWTSPFEWNGNWYNTVEHLFQGQKISLADSAKGHLFTMNSGLDWD